MKQIISVQQLIQHIVLQLESMKGEDLVRLYNEHIDGTKEVTYLGDSLIEVKTDLDALEIHNKIRRLQGKIIGE